MNTIIERSESAVQPKKNQRRRGYRFLITRGLLALAMLLLALPILGFGYETIAGAVDAWRFPPPGKLVLVNGHQMHINCSGAGDPTVVMDAGLGGWSLDWSTVQPDIATFTRVCSYDRAGLGWSGPSAAPADAQHAVDDLHRLLTNSGEHGPFVLVGHSNGGLRAALYAHAYPQEVAGVLLVDPTPRATDAESLAFLSPQEQAEYLTLLQALQPGPQPGGFDFMGAMQALRPFGVPRLLIDTLLQGSQYQHLRAEAQPAFRFGTNQPARLATNSAETEQRQTSIDQVRAIQSLGNMPLTVLTSTKLASFYSDPVPEELSGRLLELVQKTVWEAEVEMSLLSSKGTITRVERSGHFIQFDRPDVVRDAVQHMVASLQVR